MALDSDLAVPKGMKVSDPRRDADYISARGVPYYFGPDWVKGKDGKFGRIYPIRRSEDHVLLYFLSKDGNVTYAQGRVQRAFLDWHDEREIDCILLARPLEDLIITDWDYEIL